jgi:hypothetical protein
MLPPIAKLVFHPERHENDFIPRQTHFPSMSLSRFSNNLDGESFCLSLFMARHVLLPVKIFFSRSFAGDKRRVMGHEMLILEEIKREREKKRKKILVVWGI